MSQPQIWISPREKRSWRTLEDMKDNHSETVVIATHDMQLVCEWAERIIVLRERAV